MFTDRGNAVYSGKIIPPLISLSDSSENPFTRVVVNIMGGLPV